MYDLHPLLRYGRAGLHGNEAQYEPPALQASVSAEELDRLLGTRSPEERLPDQLRFAKRRMREDEAVIRAGSPCHALYVVRSGSFKTCMIDASGTVQGLGFPMTGDTIGLDGLAGGCYTCDVTAMECGEVVTIPLDLIAQYSPDHRSVATLLYRLIGREVVHDHAVLFLLGSLHAEARVAAFLLDLSNRYTAMGHPGPAFRLPMMRRDIANYLGLKVETVSRIFAILGREGCVRIHRREVEILDEAALRLNAGETLFGGHVGDGKRSATHARLRRPTPAAARVQGSAPAATLRAANLQTE